MLKSLASFLFFILFASAATAEADDTVIGLYLDYGQAKPWGSLVEKNEASASGSGIFSSPVRSEDDFWAGYFAFSVQSFRGKSRGTKFPFTKGKELLVDMTTIGPGICMGANWPVYPCYNIGLALVEVTEGEENFQRYGTFVHQLNVGRIIDPGFVAGVRLTYVDEVEQKASKVTSKFGHSTVSTIVGWNFTL